MADNAEKQRLSEQNSGRVAWQRWGPYLSERQWGTVREDYSPNGTAWDYFPHDHARSRAYRWGEDGLAGFSDDQQRLCLGLALWNGVDPILKERLFGLTNEEGNHGEDVKELYYYLDATPTHSFLKMLYKYPQREFPYAWLVEESRRRGRSQPEFELLDTGIFDDDRYFDVFVEYARAAPEDLLMRVTVHNRGPDAAAIHVLPQVWFRNTWSWTGGVARPVIEALTDHSIGLQHAELGEFVLCFEGAAAALFTENDTNVRRIFGAASAPPGHFKDAFHDFLIDGAAAAVNPNRTGTKAAVHYALQIAPGGSAVLRLRLARGAARPAFGDFDGVVEQRRAEADAFYADLQTAVSDADARLVQRQAAAGLIWTKQVYHYDIPRWLAGDPAQPPPPPQRRTGRNSEWFHLNNADVLSMPDKWEYPWYAAWDLAFHAVTFAPLDAEFAKDQLLRLTREWYMHPSGQLPAYEWAFGDVNPPVHAWAAWRVFQIDRRRRGDAVGDIAFLERILHKLLLNFTWWVNRKDVAGHNVFQGGFLGLDNIGVFDRNTKPPPGCFIAQADGTSWMAMYCLNLMRIALELALHNRVYEDIATKFFEHFLYIAQALANIGQAGVGIWDEQDQFFYDVLGLPDGRTIPLRVRSMVGLTPLFAVETLEPELLAHVPEFTHRLEWFLNYRPDLASLVSHWNVPGRGQRRLLSLLRGHRMKMLLKRMLDPGEFLGDYGVRSLSKEHAAHPYVFEYAHQRMSVSYEPGESTGGDFGGNSNWRGPIWMPVNYLIIESLQKFHHYYGDDFRIECPTGSGRLVTLNDAADDLSTRLGRLFLRDAAGRRPALGHNQKVQTDPHFRDYPLFYEYFHGEDGRGLGASHQTGWTALLARLLMPRYAARASAAADHAPPKAPPAARPRETAALAGPAATVEAAAPAEAGSSKRRGVRRKPPS